MAEVGWLLLQIFWVLPTKPRFYLPCIVSALCVILIAPCQASEDNFAVLKFETKTENCSPICSVRKLFSLQSSAKSSYSQSVKVLEKAEQETQIVGEYSNAGSKPISVQGFVVKIPDGCENDESEETKGDDSDFIDLPKDWVGIVHYGRVYGGTSENSTQKCPSVIDRVTTALMFGASAIIILSMNPKLLKELDLSQMFSKPIILIQSPENITAVLSILFRKVTVQVKITYNSTIEDLQKQTTFTWWTSCGWSIGTVHGREWAGVVCLDKQEAGTSKADPSSFWNFFYSALLTLMLLFIVKAKRRNLNGEWGAADQDMELSLRRLAHQALCLMKIKKYRNTNYSSPDKRDMCAICLDYFMPNQKIRVLPCFHEFHTRCVDTWLVKTRTCPLCKLNILGHTDG